IFDKGLKDVVVSGGRAWVLNGTWIQAVLAQMAQMTVGRLCYPTISPLRDSSLRSPFGLMRRRGKLFLGPSRQNSPPIQPSRERLRQHLHGILFIFYDLQQERTYGYEAIAR